METKSKLILAVLVAIIVVAAYIVSGGDHLRVAKDIGRVVVADPSRRRAVCHRFLDIQGGIGHVAFFPAGAGLDVAYYAQHVFKALDPKDNVFSHLAREATSESSRQDILNMAGCFLFKGDDVKKKVSVLSGGEKARVILAGLLLSKKKVLLLDEPTNHLDFETVEALGQALQDFGGVVFFISHDRTFVNLVATQIIEVKSGQLRRYPGTYEDYCYSLEMAAQGETAPSASGHKSVHKPKAALEKKKAPTTENAAASQKQQNAEARKLKQAMEKADKRMKHFTAERDKLVKELEANPLHYSKERDIKMRDLQISIEKEEDKWYKFQKKLDKLTP